MHPTAIKINFPDFKAQSPVNGDQAFLYLSLGNKLVDVRNPGSEETVVYLPNTG